MTAAQEAHLRLLTQLPVRTHERRRGDYYDASVEAAAEASRKRVRIGDMVYPSIRQAALAQKRATKTIWNWLQTGEAEYV